MKTLHLLHENILIFFMTFLTGQHQWRF